ncbi:Ig-like domain-containing protein [Kitasatospora sp. NPDC092948]|uniref:Ig-like domain-containing protein n=1 Tax=Kitasatospora sp. NPDC092948 TaxID=3364088 RepID=UPI0037F781F8
MCRQSPERAPAPDARPADRDRPGPWIGRTTTALIATGLLTGLGTPPVAAQQSPDSWSADRRAQLPSGLAVRFDWTAAPGVGVDAAPGRLAGSAYADGIRPGDPAETFRAAEDHPRADGSWRSLGTLRLSFSRPVRNPRLHLSGLTGLATGKGGATGSSTRLTVAGGSPAAPALVGRTPWPGWTVGPAELAPAADGARDGDADGAGTLELAGTVSTVDLRVDQRSTARDGSTTPPETLGRAWTVTLDEGLGSAPPSYGNASHLLSDLFLGQDATPAATRSRPGLAQSVEKPLLPAPPAAGPLAPGAQGDGGAGHRSPWANPAQPRLRPGRADYPGADPSLTLPTETTVGGTYRVEVPVSPGAGPAVLAGWVDFEHTGRFDPQDRVQADVPAGATSAVLEWPVPTGAAGGDTWVRLRLARDASQLAAADGFADSGQVVDQRVSLTVGPAAPGPEIALPIPGTVTGETRPEFRGDGAVPGAGIAVQENGSALCLAQVGGDGSWSCRPDNALGESTHTLVVAETTRGAVLRGQPFRLTVKTTAPTAPVLTLPAYSNDPGLLVTGLGEPGSTVTVSADSGPEELDLCSTAVAADGSWSCLPVENLADGPHRLTPHARDGAGNTSDGKPVELTVSTRAPGKPKLTSPAAGELLAGARPVISGSAEPGTTVTVTAGRGSGDRSTVCSVVTAADGSWSCTATHDLPGGDTTLIATASDPAGNGTAGDPVPVRVPGQPAGSGSTVPPAPPTPTAPASASPTAPASPSAPAPASPSAPASSSAVPTPSAAPSASGTASPTAPSAPGASASAPASAAASAPASPGQVSASAAAPVPVLPGLPPDVLPVVVPVLPGTVPPVGATPVAAESPSPAASAPDPGTGAPSGQQPGTASDPVPPFLLPGMTSDQSPFAAHSPAPEVLEVPEAPEGQFADPVDARAGSPSPTAAPSVAAAPSAGSPSPTAARSAAETAAAAPSAAPSGASSSPPAAADEPPGRSADEVGPRRTPAPPPDGMEAAERRAAATGWRGLACGALLITAGFGLLARRVFSGRRRGARRR